MQLCDRYFTEAETNPQLMLLYECATGCLKLRGGFRVLSSHYVYHR